MPSKMMSAVVWRMLFNNAPRAQATNLDVADGSSNGGSAAMNQHSIKFYIPPPSVPTAKNFQSAGILFY